MRLLAHVLGDPERRGEVRDRRMLLLVDVMVVEHPVQRVEVEKQGLVGIGVVREGHDARHLADPGILRLPAQGSWIGHVGQIADPYGADVGLVVCQHFSGKLGRRACVGERAVLMAEPDPVPVACSNELLAGGAVRA